MTPAETAKVLVKASAYDLRTVGQVDVIAWHEALSDIDFADALDAVTQHFRDSTERLMPAHVRRLAIAARQHRAGALPALELPPGVPLERRSANGEIEHLRQILPGTGREILRRREWVEHEKRQARALHAVPNPHFAGPPPPEGHPVPETESVFVEAMGAGT